ncbi:hypothetical protein OUZ56_009469 [Daphnia magna]|uniref:DUF4806 domain-containing protein n=1 Tax=Daphnia magna TaxID=35525 RepID=A0ABR0AG35_9CRUS|nr:hypothetical protein OUZ56_009469 [Daphnia magna]
MKGYRPICLLKKLASMTFSDNKCAWPIKDAQNRAEREEVFSTWWPRYNAKIRIIRSLGGNDLGKVLRTAWRYFMSDKLLNQLTWKGQHKTNRKKPKDIKGLQTYRLHSMQLKKKVEFTPTFCLSDLNKLSAEFVTKAGTRLAAKQKKLVENKDM